MEHQENILELRSPYTPTPIQSWIHRNLKRFNVVILHRGCGKTYLAANELIKRAATCDIRGGGVFLYVAPLLKQARSVVWDTLKKCCTYIHPDSGEHIRLPNVKIREDECSITFTENNARIILAGADAPDTLRGQHPHFVVFDEVQDMKAETLEIMAPALLANKADVIWIGTPKAGQNLLRIQRDRAREAKKLGTAGWFYCEVSYHHSGRFTAEELAQVKATMTEAKWRQEMELDWEAVSSSAFYSEFLTPEVVTNVSWDPSKPVITGWDLGTVDWTVIWFAQQSGDTIKIFDYYQNKGADKDINFYINVLKRKPYHYGYHIVPHDGGKHFLTAKKTVIDHIKMAGYRVVQVPRTKSRKEDVQAVQAILHKCRFDKERCAQGLEGLYSYRSKVDPSSGEDTGEPVDRGDDAADALKTLLLGMKKEVPKKASSHLWWMEEQEDQNLYTNYDIFNR